MKRSLVIVSVFSTFALTGCSNIFGSGDVKPSNQAIKTETQNVTQYTDVGKMVASVHEEMNNLVGWGRYKHINWSIYTSTDAPFIILNLKNAEAKIKAGNETVQDKLVVQDLNNVIKLAEIAEGNNDPTALLYLHRDVSDLAEFVYRDVTDDTYWGYTRTLKGAHVVELENYIQHNSKYLPG